MFLLVTTFVSMAGAFWFLNGVNFVKQKWSDFRDVNSLVSTRYKNCCMIIWVSISMIMKMYWTIFLQSVNNTVKLHDKHTYEISYVINGKLYKMLIYVKKGPSSVLLVHDENGDDISHQVVPFIGPNEDWNKTIFTPEFWKKKSLTFEMGNGDTKIFTEKETIAF